MGRACGMQNEKNGWRLHVETRTEKNWKTLRVDGHAVKEIGKQSVDWLCLDRGRDK